MKLNSYSIKRSLLATIFMLFVMIMAQQKIKWINELPLNGTVTYKEKPGLNYKTWFDGTFQQKYESYVNENFGFRNFFVRLNNQIAFNLFRKAKANGVVVGKENYLYERNYINAYYGIDSISDSLIDTRMQKLKFLQDTLKKLNIDLILIYAPGKAAYLPEYIPDNKKPLTTHRSNYSHYRIRSEALQINFIDYFDYFLKLKATAKYPLYPQYGIHWSSYGRNLVVDSLIHYVEKLKGIDLNDISFDPAELSDSLRDSDYDIGYGMNLLFKLKTYPMAYSNYTVEINDAKIKPKLLVVSDSYWWSIFNLGISESIFSDGKFWYYNKDAHHQNQKEPVKTNQLNLKSEIESRDLIIIMATDANLPALGWGFIENVYELYTRGETYNRLNDSLYEKRVNDYINYIRTQKEWINSVKKFAVDKKISLDSALLLNAIYMVDQELNKK